MVAAGLLIKVAFTVPVRYRYVMNATLRLGRNNARTLYYRNAVEIG